jgi:UDP-N-acetylmuramyl pentapeptide phosphotransferase/UDP-N-acetylglucosamine-1-phosphate transferase
LTALLSGVLILLKDEEYYSIVFTVVLVYTVQLLVIIITVIIYKFLQERRRFLVQNKLEYLQKKYSKIRTQDTYFLEERRRPRVYTQHLNFDDDKHVEGGI